MPGPLAAPVEVAARIGRLGSEAVPTEGPARHSCPQTFRRVLSKVPESTAALEEVVACFGQPGVVPAKGPARQFCPQHEVGRTTVGKADELPRNSLVDGRCSALSCSFSSSVGLLVVVLPLAVVSSGVAHPTVPPLSLAP